MAAALSYTEKEILQEHPSESPNRRIYAVFIGAACVHLIVFAIFPVFESKHYPPTQFDPDETTSIYQNNLRLVVNLRRPLVARGPSITELQTHEKEETPLAEIEAPDSTKWDEPAGKRENEELDRLTNADLGKQIKLAIATLIQREMAQTDDAPKKRFFSVADLVTKKQESQSATWIDRLEIRPAAPVGASNNGMQTYQVRDLFGNARCMQQRGNPADHSSWRWVSVPVSLCQHLN